MEEIEKQQVELKSEDIIHVFNTLRSMEHMLTDYYMAMKESMRPSIILANPQNQEVKNVPLLHPNVIRQGIAYCNKSAEILKDAFDIQENTVTQQ